MARSLLWYDLETFGTSASWDRIAQFAAIRTDEELHVISEPLVVCGALPLDYLPDPRAILVHGITPQEVNRRGVSEREMARFIYEEVSRPGTILVGYNNHHFDDRFLSFLFYRTFYPSYPWTAKGHGGRWDILDLVRAAHDFRPGIFTFPLNEKGRPSVKLEDIASSNGFTHTQAHDALSDVEDTISAAQVIRKEARELYDFAFSERATGAMRSVIEKASAAQEPFVHVSRMMTDEKSFSAPFFPITASLSRTKNILAFNLAEGLPTDYEGLTPEELRAAQFIKKEESDLFHRRLPLKNVHINRFSFVAPWSVIRTDEQCRALYGLSKAEVEQRCRLLSADEELLERLRQASEIQEGFTASPAQQSNPDLDLYSHFFPAPDLALFENIQSADPSALMTIAEEFQDPRAKELIFHYKARNYFDALTASERKKYMLFCGQQLTTALGRNYSASDEPPLNLAYFKQLVSRLEEEHQGDERGLSLITQTWEYVGHVEKRVLEALGGKTSFPLLG